jgi:hypothetical protein
MIANQHTMIDNIHALIANQHTMIDNIHALIANQRTMIDNILALIDPKAQLQYLDKKNNTANYN